VTEEREAVTRIVAGEAVVDAHTHVACPDRSRFPVRPSVGAGSEWYSGDAVSGEALLAEMDGAGVGRAVVVQGIGAYGHDCSCAAATVAEHPDRFALVVSVDMDGPDPSDDLMALVDALAAGRSPGASGVELAGPVRPVGVRLFGVGAATTDWLHDARAAEVWRSAGHLGLTVVPCVFSPVLDAVAEVAASHPDVPVAVDHCGFPDMAGADGWPQLLRLAGLAAVGLKVSSHVLEAGERDDGDPAVVVDRLVEAFGAERLCWGSDHPQNQALDYAGKLALARHAARHLDADQSAAFFGANAHRLWFGV
jgi:predicted TIM-barrel fold metal-dependent hydrolase